MVRRSVMSKDDDKKPGKIDFSKFRVSLNSKEQPIAEKVIVHVPVRKPSKQMFIHPDNNYNQPNALLKLEDEEKPYLISDSIRSRLAQM